MRPGQAFNPKPAVNAWWNWPPSPASGWTPSPKSAIHSPVIASQEEPT